MTKSTLFIKFIGVLLSKPSVISKALFHAVRNYEFKNIVKKYGLLNGFKELSILELCPGFDVKVSPYTFLNGTSTPIDLALLNYLAISNKVEDYFEIGTWRGESMANTAPLVKNAISLSLSKEEMLAFGFNPRELDVTYMFSKNLSNVKHIGHNSMTFDFNTLGKKFDLIFVDGDHHYEAVKSDTANVFNLLKDENSIIVWHDYTPGFEIINHEVMAGILDGAPKDKIKNIYHVTNTMCAIYTNKPLHVYDREFPASPDKIFELQIKANKI